MNNSELLKNNYPDIIHSTVNRIPENYEVIRFDKFLDVIFPNSNVFIPWEIIEKIRIALNQKYGDDSNCVKEYGVLKSVGWAIQTEAEFPIQEQMEN